MGLAGARVFAAAGVACAVATADAGPRFEASTFIGVDWFGGRTELGNSWAADQVPTASSLVGGRVGWLVLPELPARLQLAVEAELAIAPSFTGNHADSVRGGRMAYFAPVFAWRGHALLRLARWREIAPHLVIGGGGDTVASTSPFMSRDSDPIAYWGPGVSVAVSAAWHLRIDLRQGIMPARNGGATATFEAAIGLGTVFGTTDAPPRAPAPRPVEPVDNRDRDGDGIPDRLDACPDEPETFNGVSDDDGCPEPDPDGDGLIGDADRCPDQAEDFDGFQDQDGCPDPDNDDDGIDDRRDACPNQPETVNGFEDDDGCPDQVPAAITAALTTALRFEPVRARITEPAAAALGGLLAMLQGQPAVHLAIIGHPDRAPNTDLAKRRAEAVKWYLVDQGIAEDRLAISVGDVARTAVTFELAIAPR